MSLNIKNFSPMSQGTKWGRVIVEKADFPALFNRHQYNLVPSSRDNRSDYAAVFFNLFSGMFNEHSFESHLVDFKFQLGPSSC